VSTAFRIILVIAAIGTLLTILIGPAWRGNFYRSWLRPRLVAFGLIIAVLAAGEYVYRVINAIRNH
jgi:hypothetical protein